MNRTRSRSDHKCHACNKTFSKSEHLTRHIRGHTKERPFECGLCGKVYSRSDVLRRHERSHHPASSPGTTQPLGEAAMPTPTPSSQSAPIQSGSISDSSMLFPAAGPQDTSPDAQHAINMCLQDPLPHADQNSWFLGADLDVDALDFSLSSAICEWAQLPLPPSMPGATIPCEELNGWMPTPAQGEELPSPKPAADVVQELWFTSLPSSEEHRLPKPVEVHGVPLQQGKLDADESYRAGLSRELQPRAHDEALPSAEQLNLFAKLYFSRFHSLFPVIHAPTFCPTAANSLLFLSICSVGSLFVGSAHAVAQGTRIFERLNKAILASWESILSRSCPKAFSMVQAAILGQTFAILSGRPRDLVMADVLHGTVMSWARESNKNSFLHHNHPNSTSMTVDDHSMVEQWHLWVEAEHRGRVEIALNIHDAELASLLHHDPVRKHRFSQYPRLASDGLFMAPTAERWAALYKQSQFCPTPNPQIDNRFQNADGNSGFGAYGILESINSYLIEARQSGSLNYETSRNLSELLMCWWRRYSTHFSKCEEEPFSLPVLWHSIYMYLYADINLLEQAIGRNGHATALEVAPHVHAWASSLAASKCLVHALLIQRYLERMRVSSEPAIHVPRALFYAALAWLCFTRVGNQQSINLKAFEAPEIQLLGSETALHEAQGQAFGDGAFADVNHLHRLIDLLHRVGRWTITKTFASALSAALAEGREE